MPDPDRHLDYADALREAGLSTHAIDIYRSVVGTDPGNLAAWNNLGVTLQDTGDLPGAVLAFRAALRADPRNAVVLNNLGYALLEQGNAHEAEQCLRAGIALDPGIADLHNNLGNALWERMALNEAQSAYRRAIAIRPGFAQAHWNLAQVLLQRGEFGEGWSEYEWRWHRADFTSPLRQFPQPTWNGEEIAGKTILVHAEQGFGDALQFVRYVPLLAHLGANVVLECQPELSKLFSRISGAAVVVDHGGTLPPFDVHIPMMSLPRVFRTTLANVPASVPYLSVDEALKRSWCKRMGPRTQSMRVGLVWSGTRTLKALLNRTCPVEELLPILTCPGVECFSLQKGLTDSERRMIGSVPAVYDIGGGLNDFADTAAALHSLDLVVSIDTAVAHLAGALGLPVWVLLPYRADWRWLVDKEDSPWYPTMRLFRQGSGEGWRDVINRVRQALLPCGATKRETGA